MPPGIPGKSSNTLKLWDSCPESTGIPGKSSYSSKAMEFLEQPGKSWNFWNGLKSAGIPGN